MMKMTNSELHHWQDAKVWIHDLLGDKHSVIVNDVCFTQNPIIGIVYSYKRHCKGYLYADNGYLGRTDDGKDYYPMIRIVSEYCDYCPFSGSTIEPNLNDISLKIIELWNKFTKE